MFAGAPVLLGLTILASGCAPSELGGGRSETEAAPPQAQLFAGAVTSRAGDEPDDAALVLGACGRPGSDRVVILRDKLHDGPVRKVSYSGLRYVTLEFVPAEGATRSASATPWRFSVAHMAEKEIMTSSGLEPALPCAAKALSQAY